MADNDVHITVTGEDKFTPAAKKAQESGGSLAQDLGKLAVAAVGVTSAFVGFEALKGAVDKTEELGEATKKLMDTQGLTAEKASGLLFVFQQYDIGGDSAVKMLDIFDKKLKGVQDTETGVLPGGKTMVALLKEIGVNALDSAGNIEPVDQILGQVADKFQSMPDGVEKTGLAMQFFGRQGAAMIPVLNLGSKGISDLEKTAQSLGLTLSGENVAQIHDYTLAHREMQQALGGVRLEIGEMLMPLLTTLATWFVQAQPQIRAFVTDGVDKTTAAFDLLKTATSPVVAGLKMLSASDIQDGIKAVATGMLLLAAAFVAMKIGSAVTAIYEFVAALQVMAAEEGVVAAISMATPLAGITALAAGLAALDFGVRKLTGEGLVGWFKLAFEGADLLGEALKKIPPVEEQIAGLMREGASNEQALGIVTEQLTAEANQLTSEYEHQAAQLKALKEEGTTPYNKELLQLLDSHRKTGAELDAYVQRIKDEHLKYDQLNAVVGNNTELQKRLAPELATVKKAHDDLASATKNEASQTDMLKGIVGALDASYKDLTDAIKGAKDVLDRPTTEELQLDAQIARIKQVIDGYKQRGEAVPAELQKESDALDANKRSMEDQRAVNNTTAAVIEANYQKVTGRVLDLHSALAGLPSDIQTRVLLQLDGASVAQIDEKIRELKAERIGIPVDFIRTHDPGDVPSYPRRAGGGPASGLTWVGERGPELVDLPGGSYVHSNAEARQMLASASVGTTSGPPIINNYIGQVIMPGDANTGLAALGVAVMGA